MLPSNIRRDVRKLHGGGARSQVYQVFRGDDLLFERMTPIADAEIEDWLAQEMTPRRYLPSDQTDIRRTFDRVKRQMTKG